MANTQVLKGRVLPNTTTKANVHEMIDDAQIIVSNIANADIKSDAAIVDTKLATISSIGKVNLSALAITGQTAGDILWANADSTLTRLPIGTAGQSLTANYDSYTKLMLHGDGTDAGTTVTDSIGKTVTNTASYDSYTKLLCEFEGADEATTDTAETGQTITFAGGAKLENTQKKFGSTALYLDGDGDYVTVPDSADWDFGTGDFTIDGQFRFSNFADTYQDICNQYTDADNEWYFILVNADKTFRFYYKSGGTVRANYTTSAATLVADTWYHIAAIRYGSTFKIYVDGVALIMTETTAIGDLTALTGTPVLRIGYVQASTYFVGYIDEFRISKGIARWTTDFDVPTYPYGQVITSTTEKKFGTASLYFDGAGSYLSLADSADWDFGTGDFTIDFQLRFVSVAGTQVFISQGTNTTDYWRILFEAGKIYFFHTVGGVIADYSFTSAYSFVADTWYHFALVRSGACKMYINGTEVATTETTTSSGKSFGGITAVLNIGRLWDGTYFFNGYLDEFRVSKGIARWTSDFTVLQHQYNPNIGWA